MEKTVVVFVVVLLHSSLQVEKSILCDAGGLYSQNCLTPVPFQVNFGHWHHLEIKLFFASFVVT